MKKILVAFAVMTMMVSCSTSLKIPVRYNKYGPLHYVKYEKIDGRFYVKGREVKLVPGTEYFVTN